MTLETILRTVLHAAAWSAFVAFCGVVATVGVCSMLRLLCHALAETGRTCGKFVAMTFASVALVCAVVGGGKALNGPPDGVSAPARVMSTARGAPETCLSSLAKAQRSAIAPETCLRGPANAPETLPPHLAALVSAANAQDVPRWELRGAYDDAIRIPAVGWDFRTPDGFIEGMTVFSRGEFRPDVGHLYFPRPFTNDLALLPRAKWHLLPGGGESKLWYAATPSNSLLVTWVNGLLDRNPLTPTNFQAEFFPDGSYEYRYGATSLPRETIQLPFDRDGDGLENTVDPDPETAGPDAHNTNDEWYGIVCSNVFDRVVCEDYSEILWRDGVNPSSYYFVDVVAERGPTPIYFHADRESPLGSPVVVAERGVTNRVPLLIGVSYAVTSDVPVSVSVPWDGYATVETNDALNLTVRWPLGFMLTELTDGGFRVDVYPFDPGGTFTWRHRRGGGTGPSLMAGIPGTNDCEFVWDGTEGHFNCIPGCEGCTVEGTFEHEGTLFEVPSYHCPCSHIADPDEDEPSPPTVSVSFSVPAVIYEDAYDNTPSNHVARRSSGPVVLRIDASGGTQGTTLTLTPSNMDRLHRLYGDAAAFGARSIPANGTVSYVIVYDAQSPSAVENDITLQATVEDRVNGGTITSCATTMVMRVEIIAPKEAPKNPCRNRHAFGIGEKMQVVLAPLWTSVELSVADATIQDYGFGKQVVWGIADVNHTFTLRLHDVEYDPFVQVLKPTGIEGRGEYSLTCGLPPGQAGGIKLVQDFYVLPETVRFDGIAIEEVPCDVVLPPSGYYHYLPEGPLNRLSHTRAAGAGVWLNVDDQNRAGGGDHPDKAGSFDSLPRMTPDGVVTNDVSFGWMGGDKTWMIPFGWGPRDSTSSTEPIGRFAEGVTQGFHITAQGDYRIEKLGHSSERKINGEVFTDGNPGFFPPGGN